ncbi:hypothetical protein PF003_g21653, partial [Phytophthora fragariae]
MAMQLSKFWYQYCNPQTKQHTAVVSIVTHTDVASIAANTRRLLSPRCSIHARRPLIADHESPGCQFDTLPTHKHHSGLAMVEDSSRSHCQQKAAASATSTNIPPPLLFRCHQLSSSTTQPASTIPAFTPVSFSPALEVGRRSGSSTRVESSNYPRRKLVAPTQPQTLTRPFRNPPGARHSSVVDCKKQTSPPDMSAIIKSLRQTAAVAARSSAM